MIEKNNLFVSFVLCGLLRCLDETLCEPATYGLVIEFQAGVGERDVDRKDHNHRRPRCTERVELILDQPSVEEVHHRVMYDIQRIGYIAQELTYARRDLIGCFARGG